MKSHRELIVYLPSQAIKEQQSVEGAIAALRDHCAVNGVQIERAEDLSSVTGSASFGLSIRGEPNRVKEVVDALHKSADRIEDAGREVRALDEDGGVS